MLRLFAANWKMNNGPTAARHFIREFSARYAPRDDAEVAFFPTDLALAAALDEAGPDTRFSFGVQTVYSADRGAFTGENSASIARDAGATLTLVGHSERRHLFGETDLDTAARCVAAERAGLRPVLCVGETLQQREQGETDAVVTEQLTVGLSQLGPECLSRSIVAYEPVWAIGTGRNAQPEDAARVHTLIRGLLNEIAGASAAAGMRILYGGSVTPANVAELLAADNVNGVLVGGASLAVDSWLSVCEA